MGSVIFGKKRKYYQEGLDKGLDPKKAVIYAVNQNPEEREYRRQEQEIKRKQEEMKKQQAQFEADQKRRSEESANQARLSAQLAADSGTSDVSEILTGGDLLGDTPETGVRRRRRKASGASAVGL